jgi:hypothetical protein
MGEKRLPSNVDPASGRSRRYFRRFRTHPGVFDHSHVTLIISARVIDHDQAQNCEISANTSESLVMTCDLNCLSRSCLELQSGVLDRHPTLDRVTALPITVSCTQIFTITDHEAAMTAGSGIVIKSNTPSFNSETIHYHGLPTQNLTRYRTSTDMNPPTVIWPRSLNKSPALPPWSIESIGRRR